MIGSMSLSCGGSDSDGRTAGLAHARIILIFMVRLEHAGLKDRTNLKLESPSKAHG